MKMGYHSELNIPVQMFCLMEMDGKITPLFFKFKDDGGHIQKVDIVNILQRNERNYYGVRELRYVCRGKLEERKNTVDLLYEVDTQRWRIYQMIS